MQPFRKGSTMYASTCLPGVSLTWREEHVVVTLPELVPVWSNAVYHGGSWLTERIVNHMVTTEFDCSDPVQHMRNKCEQWEYHPVTSVGLITAAKLSHTSLKEKEGDAFSVLCCTTAGTLNAARAGIPRQVHSDYKPGTINTVIIVDGDIGQAAVWNLVMTATEAKCAALADTQLIDGETGKVATGTTTDAIVIAVINSGRYRAEHLYAGTATTIGNTIGCLVYDTVSEAVRTQHEVD
ncbi:adenosylcobinamide amidohydrolase [Paenibacillus sp. 481]|uniref:adenosylcobinamide amidohydrolase n=1 Tax=Paenibacillus sp. 481 TaxID=2835869 RepID=UPI001E386608|nr:adenosylcobinamide amidohydrolase [Paenibacillus sp. 481]UHA72099.1 adenosylcobinamide amidohydrolase [Paenibacillus sp. 481]